MTLVACIPPAAPPAIPEYPDSATLYHFPSDAELAPYRNVEAHSLHNIPVVFIDDWTVDTSAGDRVGIEPGTETQWSRLLQETTHGAKVQTTRGMQCVAAELGRFFLMYQALPDLELRRFIVARCGAPNTQLSFGLWTATAQGEVDEERVYVDAKPSLLAELNKLVVSAPQVGGGWFGQSGDRLVVLMTTSRVNVDVKPESAVQLGRRWTFRAEVHGNFARVEALATAGKASVAPCVAVKTGPWAFDFSCPLAPGNPQTLVDIQAYTKDAVVGLNLGHVMAHRGDADSRKFQRAIPLAATQHSAAGAALPAPQSQRSSEQLIELINRLRKQNGLAPVQHSAQQSQEHRELSGALFSSRSSNDARVAQQIVLGLAAGRHLPSSIRDAVVFTSVLEGSTSLEHWASSALQSPLGRATVLAPDAEYLAVAGTPMTGGVQGLAVTATAYMGFNAETTAEFSKAFLEELDRQRLAAGNEPSTLTSLEGWSATVDCLNQSSSAGECFHSGLQKQGDLAVPQYSFYFESADAAEHLEFPPDLINLEHLKLALAVGHHRPINGDWGQYVVFLANVRR